jgi:hypothetical protein
MATALVTTLVISCLAWPAMASDPQAEASAMKVLDAFMRAFNGGDLEAFEQTLHFPHYRISSSQVTVLDAAGTRPGAFERFAEANPGWHHSAWERREVVHSGPEKVHIDTHFVRYREDGSVLSRFDSLYVVTKQDGRWGIKARSSFAP